MLLYGISFGLRKSLSVKVVTSYYMVRYLPVSQSNTVVIIMRMILNPCPAEPG